MTETRKGFKLIKEFPEGEIVVSMITHHDDIIIATNKSVYKHIWGSQQFEPMEFWVKEPEPLVVPDDEPLRPYRCVDCKYYKDEAETGLPGYYCIKLKGYRMNAKLPPPGDCPLEKI
jgi:hypothetical protein